MRTWLCGLADSVYCMEVILWVPCLSSTLSSHTLLSPVFTGNSITGLCSDFTLVGHYIVAAPTSDWLIDWLLAGPDVWKRMLLRCPLLSWRKISSPFRENINVIVFPFPFHVFMPLANLCFILNYGLELARERRSGMLSEVRLEVTPRKICWLSLFKSTITESHDYILYFPVR